MQVVQLRKACSHPYLFDGVEPEPFEEGEHLVQVIIFLEFCPLTNGLDTFFLISYALKFQIVINYELFTLCTCKCSILSRN